MKKTEKKGYIHPIVTIVNNEPLCADINGVSGMRAGHDNLYNQNGESYNSDNDNDDKWKGLGAKSTSPDFETCWDSSWEIGWDLDW